MLKFDERNLEIIANAVIRLNPYAKGYTIPQMVERMKQVARETPTLETELGYVASYGFMLTAFRATLDGDGEATHIRASIADHCFNDI